MKFACERRLLVSTLTMIRFIPTLLLSLILPGILTAGPLILHPKGTALPADHQGPFVTTGDGGVLCFDAQRAHVSKDEGKTWESHLLFRDPKKFEASYERALVRTREGVVIAAFMNMKEKSFTRGFKWGGPPGEYAEWILPTYIIRSLDDGKTWEEPQLLNRPWCGCVHSMIQTKTGRIVLVAQEVIPEWRHATVMFVSDDQGKTWKRSNVLDIGEGRHDHAGSCEGTVIERADGSLYQLIRTETGWLYEASSTDGGLTWVEFKKSPVRSVTCCAQLARLSDGRAALLWNLPPRYQPDHKSLRDELSIAFSSDDCRTWSKPRVIAARYPVTGDKAQVRRVSYPYLYERKPGELWITTMQGELRMSLRTEDIDKAEVLPPAAIVMFGDSTTAFRPNAIKQVYSERVYADLLKKGTTLVVANRGVGGNTTEMARARMERDVLALKPKLVVIQFGINDAAVDVWKKPPVTTPRVTQERYVENLRWMVGQLQSTGSKVVLMTPNPLRWTERMKEMYGKPPYDGNDLEGFDKLHLRAYAEAMRGVAAEMKVPLVDIHAAYAEYSKSTGKPAETLLLDGVHPNDDGQQLVADKLLPVIRSELGGKP